jgi:poly(A) polymerase
VIRFAAKLGFSIDPKTRTPIQEMASLLESVPASRTFDEMIKLLQTGHALASIEELRKQGLVGGRTGVFPILDVVLDDANKHPERAKFVKLALADTDRRVGEGKPVAPSFMLACMLWHDVQDRWQKLKAGGEPTFPALQQAVDAAFDDRIGDISGRGKLAADMREIWMMQPRFERRSGSGPLTLVEQPRFRAGFDFLRLRADAGEVEAELAGWWEDFSLADADERAGLLEAARAREPARRSGGAPRPARAAGAVGVAEAAEAGPETGDAADPARKRRRRRRKPTGSGEGSPSTPPSA